MREILGRQVEGDEHGLRHLDEIDKAAEELFHKAKYEHRARFKDGSGRHFIMTREGPGHYLVAEGGDSSGWL